jgi:asparaginyl-tRNA synthetase
MVLGLAYRFNRRVSMVQTTTVDTIGQFVDQTVTIRGWLYSKRSSGKIRFLLIRDGTGTIQAVVVKNEVSPATFALTDTLTQESSLVVTGTVHVDARSPGGHELQVSDITVVQVAEDYPITPKEHGPAFLLDHRHLWLRSAKQHAILRIRSQVIEAARDYLNREGFILFDAPILTPAACEGTTTLFETDYFYDEKLPIPKRPTVCRGWCHGFWQSLHSWPHF